MDLGRIVISAVGVVALAMTGVGAHAKPLDKGHFEDSFSFEYDCDGTPARDEGEVKGSYLVNKRGKSPFPFYRESVRGTIVTTNLTTERTLTQVFTASSRDAKIIDNGDGTITIVIYGSGGSRYYDSDGTFVLKDPGQLRYSIDIDYGGTPTDPSDDEEVPGSFEIVRASTGNSNYTGQFCDILRRFTS